jgi:hypothetical protein
MDVLANVLQLLLQEIQGWVERKIKHFDTVTV